MQAYQSPPCPYCGATWNPPGAQACVNCHNALPPAPPAYAPPGYAPGQQPGVPGQPPGQDPQAGYPYGQPNYPGQAQPGYPQYPGQPQPGYPPQYQDPYGQAAQGGAYPGYPPNYQQAGYSGQYPGYAPGAPGVPTGTSITVFGRQIALPFALPAGLNPQRLQSILLAAGGAVVLLFAFFGVLPAIASGQVDEADRVLSAAYVHQARVDTAMTDFLRNVSGSGASTPDAERTMLNNQIQTEQAALDLVQQDETGLSSVDQRLSIFAWAALPKRGAIDAERHRLSNVLTGLRSADQALTAFINIDKLAVPIFDVSQDLVKIGSALGRRDYAGAAASYPDAHAKIQDALQLAMAAGIPKEYTKLTHDLSSLVEDTQGFVQAMQAKNNMSAQKYNTQVQADARAVAGFDAMAADADIKKAFQPMIDAYDAWLKTAKNS